MQTSKVRQRFVVKPPTAHIVCMKAIPGSIEESSEFTDSALIDVNTSWVAESFTPPSESSIHYYSSRSSFLYVTVKPVFNLSIVGPC